MILATEISQHRIANIHKWREAPKKLAFIGRSITPAIKTIEPVRYP